MTKLRLTERQLTNLIEDTINEGILLTEKKVCGWGNGKLNKVMKIFPLMKKWVVVVEHLTAVVEVVDVLKKTTKRI